MLRLLLDEHISGAVARQFRAKFPQASIMSLQEWESGAFLGMRDEIILAAAHEQGLTLVAYDLRTIVPLAKSLMEAGTPHGGLILVDQRTVAPNDLGGLIQALGFVYEESADTDWTDQVLYLTRSG